MKCRVLVEALKVEMSSLQAFNFIIICNFSGLKWSLMNYELVKLEN